MKLSFNWIKDFVKLSPPWSDIADRLTMAGLEVEHFEASKKLRDHLMTVEVTSNRPDWLSHIGVAREIAAIENLRLKLPPLYDELRKKKPAPTSLVAGLNVNATS